jgi:uncharacterized protein
MPRPGTDVVIVDALIPGGPSLDTGQAFFAGVAERGPLAATKVSSAKSYSGDYGSRSGGSLLNDAVAAFFSEGGETLYVSRVASASAAAATIAFGSATVDALSPGAWGNGVSIDAVAPASLSERMRAQSLEGDPRVAGDPIVVVVSDDGDAVERSSTLANIDELVAWSQSSEYVRVVKGADNVLPASGTTAALTGGTDGGALTTTDLETALALFDVALGPGQVAAPGYTSSGAHDALLAHADATKRIALLDLPDSSDPLVLGAASARLRGAAGSRFAAAFAPWAEYPGPAAPSTVLVPYSGVQAGLLARLDSLGNPAQAAAGVNGVSRSALGLSQTFTDDDREALNENGVTTVKEVYGDVRTYGGRTVVDPDADQLWLWLGGSRTVMAISFQAGAIAENYVLRAIDGRGQLFAALEGDLRGMLLGYYNVGALYGSTPQDAFYVDTGPTVNTPATINAGEVHATIYVKTSPSAEYVRIDIVKVPIEHTLPSADPVAA